MAKEKQLLPHEKLEIGILLAFAGGYLDAYTFLIRGGVFANAQTGNIVLMGISAAVGNWLQAFYHLVPIAAFWCGIFLTEMIKKKFSPSRFIRWEHTVLIIEIILLFLVGLCPSSVPDGIVNVAVAFVCALQVQSFRKVHDVPYASTMCTGNLRSSAENLFVFIKTGDKSYLNKFIKYILIIVCFVAGAAAGALFSDLMAEKSVWLCCAVLFTAFLLLTFGAVKSKITDK